ncbi:MAG: SufE family protein [Bacteroidales bacterium]|nr:SufE family protein [Bacteroidales bacterium]
MKTIDQTQQEIVEEFSMFSDWMDKYEYIIDMGKNLEQLPDDFKKDEFLIPGCQSRVWLVPEFRDDKVFFKTDSDAIITKGIACLIVRIFNGRTKEEISKSKLFFIEKIGLVQNLSPTRANGLASMVDKIYRYVK